jgi:Mitochondrial carrier protein.
MLTQTFQKEGIRGIYRGVSAPLVAISPMFAVSFWGYDMGKRIVQAVDERYIAKHTNNHIGQDAAAAAVAYPFTISQLCLAGGISALPTTLIMAPSERLKCLLQIHPERYSGLWDCAKKVYAEGGIQSVFRGTGATLLRDVPGSIAWFGTYELVKKGLMKVQKIDPESGALSPLAVLCAGGVAGMACWGVSIPADVLKSRFQTAPAGTYSGVMDVYRHLMKEEGPGALFRGLRPAMIRAFPANAACFFGMEVSKKAFAFMD